MSEPFSRGLRHLRRFRKKINKSRSLAITLLALASLTSCGKKLRPDPIDIPAQEANYPTAEIWVKDEFHHGLVMTSIKRGRPYRDLRVRVQGYYKGSVQIESEDCGISLDRQYTQNELIDVDIPRLADRDCVISVLVTPSFDGQDVKVHSFQGHIGIKVLDYEDDDDDYINWVGHQVKMSDVSDPFVEIDTGTAGDEADVFLSGCGKEMSDTISMNNGVVVIPMGRAVEHQKQLCVLEGRISVEEYEDLHVNILVAVYDNKFTPLTIPMVKVGTDTIDVEARQAVSIISLNEEYEFDYDASFEFDRYGSNILRLLTVKGRSVLGKWDNIMQRWIWVQ